MTTAQLSFPTRTAPLRLKDSLLYGDHKAPPRTLQTARQYITEVHGYGCNRLTIGVNTVVTKTSQLLGSLQDYRRLVLVGRDAGITVDLAFWHKSAREWDLRVQEQALSLDGFINAPGEQRPLQSTMFDMEHHTFNVRGFSPTRHATSLIPFVENLKSGFAITANLNHIHLLGPYEAFTSWLLAQVLSHNDPSKHIGVANPRTLPGLWIEDVIDKFDGGSWSAWREKVVLMCAAYKQEYGKGVDREDAVGVCYSSILASGRRSGAIFSKLWLDADPQLQREVRRRSPQIETFGWSYEGRDEEEPVKFVEEVVQPVFQGRSEKVAALLNLEGLRSKKVRGEDAELLVTFLREIWSKKRRSVDGKPYQWFVHGFYNVNLFGIRGHDPKAGRVDDIIGLAYQDAGGWCVDLLAGSVDPGPHYLKRPVAQARREGGTFATAEGQYPQSHQLGAHRGRPAIVQRPPGHGTPLDGWRDNNRDGEFDFDTAKRVSGWYWINIHPQGRKNLIWGDAFNADTAGCWGIASIHSHDTILLPVARKAVKNHGRFFTTTLIHRRDVEDQLDLWTQNQ